MSRALVTLLALSLAWPARAEPRLRVTTEEFASWPEAVGAMREERASQVHVRVTGERDWPLRCDEYVLTLDEAGSRAFVLEGCEPETGATRVRLVDRHALFARAGGVAQAIVPALEAHAPPPRPPPPPSRPAPPPVATCWAVVGPQVTDAESGAEVRLDTVQLAVDVATEPAGAPVQTVAFDHAWLIRVPEDSGVREVRYALAPWHSRRRGGISADTPAGVVRRTLPLQCSGDPLGAWLTTKEFEVPNRVVAPLASGEQVELRRWRSDGGLWAQWIVARSMSAFGGLGVMLGVPATIVAASSHGAGRRFGPLSQDAWRATALLGGGSALLVGGLALEFSAGDQLLVRWGTSTVGAP